MELDIEGFIRRETENKVRRYRELNQAAQPGGTVLAGSSLMENFPVNELLMDRDCGRHVYNRGMSSLTIAEYAQYLDVCVLDLKPSKLVINIGSNDLNLPGDTVGNLIANYRALLSRVQKALPDCEIVLLAYYPCLRGEPRQPVIASRIPRTQASVLEANRRLQELARELNVRYLDVNAAVSDPDGYLDPSIALDDIHFSPAGYVRVLDLLEPEL